MNPVLKIVVYIALLAGAWVFGHRFFAIYTEKVDRAAHRLEPVESTNAPASNPLPTTIGAPGAYSYMGFYAAGAFGAVVVFGFLFAHDLSHYLASRTTRELYNDEGEGTSSPEYEQAEQVWADGDHLEAIRLMREYLKKYPREQHVALRIAEIYENDLKNLLAAALEYEEILTKKLAPERWGWAAIHLCNLYYQMDQEEKSEAMLRRIVAEYGQTAAAKKARERLGLPEDAEVGPLAAAEEEESVQPGGFKLPPGFKPKKG